MEDNTWDSQIPRDRCRLKITCSNPVTVAERARWTANLAQILQFQLADIALQTGWVETRILCSLYETCSKSVDGSFPDVFLGVNGRLLTTKWKKILLRIPALFRSKCHSSSCHLLFIRQTCSLCSTRYLSQAHEYVLLWFTMHRINFLKLILAIPAMVPFINAGMLDCKKNCVFRWKNVFIGTQLMCDLLIAKLRWFHLSKSRIGNSLVCLFWCHCCYIYFAFWAFCTKTLQGHRDVQAPTAAFFFAWKVLLLFKCSSYTSLLCQPRQGLLEQPLKVERPERIRLRGIGDGKFSSCVFYLLVTYLLVDETSLGNNWGRQSGDFSKVNTWKARRCWWRTGLVPTMTRCDHTGQIFHLSVQTKKGERIYEHLRRIEWGNFKISYIKIEGVKEKVLICQNK